MGDTYDQVYTFILYAVLIGMALGVIYDVFRIIRMWVSVPGIISDRKKEKEHKSTFFVNTVVFICDILFFLITAVISAIFIFHVNNGRIRGIALAGSLLGFVAYYNTVGRLVTMISGFIIRGVYFIFRFILNGIILPCVGFLKKILNGILSFITMTDGYLLTWFRTKRLIYKAGKGFKK